MRLSAYFFLALFCAQHAANADEIVRITRIEQDLYRTTTGAFIRTKYCHEHVYGDDAIIKYRDYAFDNKLIFPSGASCEVEGWENVYKWENR